MRRLGSDENIVGSAARRVVSWPPTPGQARHSSALSLVPLDVPSSDEILARVHPELRALIGHTIAGRYRIDELIAVGGMAAVFRAQHLGLHRDVAIKILHPNLNRNPEISARFDREARSVSKLEHPNCLRVMDFGRTEQGMSFMVMQFLEGVELWELLSTPIMPLRAVELVLQILRGLEHAHSQGIVHRDIKPENVFIARDHYGRDVLKLVDFGIAKILGSDSDGFTTTEGLVFGTPAYMSPEQAAGMEADGRADLYSTGIIFYQMLAGRMPFFSEDAVQLTRMQIGAAPPPLPAWIPPVVAAVVDRLVAKDRDQRFQTATEVIGTLEGLLPLLENASATVPRADDGSKSQSRPLPSASGSASFHAASNPALAASNSAHPSPGVSGSSSGQMGRSAPASASSSHPVASVSASHLVGAPTPIPAWERTTIVTTSEGGKGLRWWPVFVTVGFAAALSAMWLTWPDAQRFPPVQATQHAQAKVPERRVDSGVARPSDAKLAELDRMLLSSKLDQAAAMLGKLRRTYPEDPGLLWRHGRLLTKSKRREAEALAMYGAALQVRPELVKDRDFYAELYELMRSPKVRQEAVDLAVRRMDRHGHKFLLELVNDVRKPLPYHSRRRALAELKKNPDNVSLIDANLNMALDLLQARQAVSPCRAYREALDAIESLPDEYFYSRVDKAPIPAPPRDAVAEERRACAGLAEKRAAVLAQLDEVRTDVILVDQDAPVPNP